VVGAAGDDDLGGHPARPTSLRLMPKRSQLTRRGSSTTNTETATRRVRSSEAKPHSVTSTCCTPPTTAAASMRMRRPIRSPIATAQPRERVRMPSSPTCTEGASVEPASPSSGICSRHPLRPHGGRGHSCGGDEQGRRAHPFRGSHQRLLHRLRDPCLSAGPAA